MFGSRRRHQQKMTSEMTKLIGTIVEANAGSKGRGAERLEAMAVAIAAMNVDITKVDEVDIDWKALEVEGDEELVPVLKIKFTKGMSTIYEQISTKPKSLRREGDELFEDGNMC